MRPAEFTILEGDALGALTTLPARSVQACVTSPPYFGLRDYGEDGQLGMEATLGEYVERLVAIFEEVRRVLRPDGTLWLNLGDSYATRWASARNATGRGLRGGHRERTGQTREGFKEKDLMGVPWRVAFALQDAGWYLRKAIVWEKPNPTPEPVRDRPTSAHEYVFLLAPSVRYHYDIDGYREPWADERRGRDGSKLDSERNRGGRTDGFTKPNGIDPSHHEGRQVRDVWRIPTVPFPGAHFAVFPPELPRRCILLGTSPRACPECRAPWRRIVRRRRLLDGEPVAGTWGEDTRTASEGDRRRSGTAGHRMAAQGVGHWRFSTERREVGWRPTCTCGAPHGVEPGDLDEIESPINPRSDDGEDPTLEVGRAGLARLRRGEEGVRIMTRWEQRNIARQLAGSPHRREMEAEAGPATFAHYLRTDSAGARPPRPDLLDAWLERGWLQAVESPAEWWNDDDTGRCLVLDPFAGAGTTGLVAIDEGRDFVGIELSPRYAQMARERIAERASTPRLDFTA